MQFLYGLCLLGSIAGLALIDRRLQLAMWNAPRRTLGVVGVSVAGFLLWDLAGIGLGIFFRGPGPYQSGVLLAPELPIEEVLFLTLLSYLTLLVFVGAQRRFGARA